MKVLKKTLEVVGTVVLSACASLPIVQPKTLDQRIAFVEMTVSATITSIAENVEQGNLTKRQGEFALYIANQIKMYINDAWLYYKYKRLSESEAALSMAEGMLDELNRYLKE